MRHLPRPRSKTFRIVLAMALLAWASLAFGAPPVAGPMGGAQAHMTAVDASVHCTSMPQAHADPRHHSTPGMPDGQGGCCSGGGCHCLFPCSVALLVPFTTAGAMSKAGRAQARIFEREANATAAPPLRPPIA